MGEKKHKQHYVWRHYLRAWAANDIIWCSRYGKIFNPNIEGIGQSRDFYRLKDLTKNDIDFLEKYSETVHAGILSDLNKSWIAKFKGVFTYRDALLNHGCDDLVNKKFDVIINNFEEDMHSEIESNAIDFIESLKVGNADFYKDDQKAMSFAFFICLQFVRTQNIQRKVHESVPDIKGASTVNIWPVMRFINATNMAWNLYSKRSEYKVVVLSADPEKLGFITGDQPVINTFAAGILKGEIPKNTEFYYPISPSKAILLTNLSPVYGLSKIDLPPDLVHKYNTDMAKMSKEQIYADSKAQVERYSAMQST